MFPGREKSGFIKDARYTVGEWTDDDIDKFQVSFATGSPNARITTMQARLDNLKDVTPIIKMHVDAIRAIHAGMNNHHSATWAELERLNAAEILWEKIIILRDVMPKANMGARHSKEQSEKAKRPRGKITDRGETISDIIDRLACAKDELGDHIPAPSLWEPLFAALQDAGAEPVEKRNNGEPRKSSYSYTPDAEKTKSISRGRFETRIAECRKKKLSR